MNSTSPARDNPTPARQDWDLEEVVATTWAVIAACGWTPITSASDERPATRLVVRVTLTNDAPPDERHRTIANSLPAGRDRASAVISAILRTTGSDGTVGAIRLANMGANRIDTDHLAPIVTAVATQMGKAHRRGLVASNQQRRGPDRVPIGLMWEHINITGIVIQVRFVRGFVRGTHNTQLLIDCGSFAVKLVAGRRWVDSVELGDEITVSGEVRGHEDWSGWSATVLSDTQPVAQPTPTAAARPSRRQAGVRRRFQYKTNQAAKAVARRTAS